MEADQIIEVVQAFKDGKQIEFKITGDPDDPWEDISSPTWSFDRFTYRIKPEPRVPRVIWVTEYADEGDKWGGSYPDRKTAESRARGDSDFIAARKFIEVVEEEA